MPLGALNAPRSRSFAARERPVVFLVLLFSSSSRVRRCSPFWFAAPAVLRRWPSSGRSSRRPRGCRSTTAQGPPIQTDEGIILAPSNREGTVRTEITALNRAEASVAK